MNKRIEREKKTVSLMIGMHCTRFHSTSGGSLCGSCAGLREYALQRTDHCRFGEEKPVCSACPVHCYKKDRRDQIREVMRHAGPHMMLQHPWLALLHIADKRRAFRWTEPPNS